MITPLKLFGPPDNLGVFELQKMETSPRLRVGLISIAGALYRFFTTGTCYDFYYIGTCSNCQFIYKNFTATIVS